MPGRVSVITISILLLASPLLPQCNFNPVLSAQFRSSFFDLAVDGNDLWAATSYGIALYDRSIDPPRLMASTAIAGATRLVRASNGLAYAGSGNSLVVVRKSGRTLQLLRSIDAGAAINDMLLTTLSLYIATRNGIAQYDLLDPTNPTRTPATFPTSQPAVLSLALLEPTPFFAADGDASVEIFDITHPTVPQKIGTVDAPPSAIAVHANNGRLYVSSPLKTTVFQGANANLGSIGVSTTSFAPITREEAAFIGSTDRTLRGIDFARPGAPIEIFRDDLPPTSGTVNRINALTTAGGRLYAGAGDIGLVTYDISAFSTPFPMRSYALANVTSVVSLGDKFYVGRTNGVTEFNQSLVRARSWDGSRNDIVHDGGNDLLLTSSGASMTLWSLIAQVPTVVSTANFRAAVSDAVLIGTTVYAVLSDRTLWSADLAQAAPAPQAITLSGIRPSSIARSGSSVALADSREDGTTLVAYYATAQLTNTPKTVTLAGLPTGGITLSNGRAALQTFRGISIIDFGSDSTVVLPQSNIDVARQLFLAGSTLLELTDTALRVWNTQTQSVSAEITLPATPLAIDTFPPSTVADIATSAGVVTVALDRIGRMPSAKPAANGNAYYKRVAASATRIYLADSRGVDIFTTALRYAGSIRASGIIDVAVNDSGVFTLSGNLSVNAYTPDGDLLSSTSIAEGADAQALSIAAAGGAVWASIVRGCSSGGCEKKTIVFDLRLNQTGSMTGAVLDVVTNGPRSYAITDLPAEIRVINTSDPLHPIVINSRAAEGTPLSIAYANGTLYVLGTTLASYSESSLTKIAEILGPYGSYEGVTFADQHLRIDSGCGVLTGRSFGPTLYSAGPQQWSPQSTPASPSAGRSIAVRPGTMYILTDHSLEIWSTAPLPKPPRRAPAR
jgi:hypothetical protein